MTPLLPTKAIAVLVPMDACDFGIVHIYAGEDILYWYKEGCPHDKHYGGINIASPNYTFICTSNGCTEEEAGKIVEKVFHETARLMLFRNYSWTNYHQVIFMFRDAFESLRSLLIANGLNPEENFALLIKND